METSREKLNASIQKRTPTHQKRTKKPKVKMGKQRFLTYQPKLDETLSKPQEPDELSQEEKFKKMGPTLLRRRSRHSQSQAAEASSECSCFPEASRDTGELAGPPEAENGPPRRNQMAVIFDVLARWERASKWESTDSLATGSARE